MPATKELTLPGVAADADSVVSFVGAAVDLDGDGYQDLLTTQTNDPAIPADSSMFIASAGGGSFTYYPNANTLFTGWPQTTGDNVNHLL